MTALVKKEGKIWEINFQNLHMNLINHTRIWTMVVEICSLCDLFVQANGFVCVWMNFLLKVDKSIVVLVPRKSEVLK